MHHLTTIITGLVSFALTSCLAAFVSYRLGRRDSAGFALDAHLETIIRQEKRIKELEAELTIRRRNGAAVDALFPGGYDEMKACRERIEELQAHAQRLAWMDRTAVHLYRTNSDAYSAWEMAAFDVKDSPTTTLPDVPRAVGGALASLGISATAVAGLATAPAANATVARDRNGKPIRVPAFTAPAVDWAKMDLGNDKPKVIPFAEREHVLSADCWCNPTVEKFEADSPEERLVEIYKELLELLDADETCSFKATVSLAADTLAPVVALTLASKAAA